MNEGRKITDKHLKDLEREIQRIFQKANKELQQEMKQVLSVIEEVKEKKSQLASKKFHYARIMALSTIFSEVISNASQLAVDLIDDNSLDVYEVNYNYSMYEIEKKGIKIKFALVNKKILKAILSTVGNPFYFLAVDKLKDKKNVTNQVASEITIGLVKGEGYQKIAKRIQSVTEKNLNKCITIARTETTRIENLAKNDLYQKLEEEGLQMDKQWVSTYDKRTRSSHRNINHETREIGEKFSNGLEYPADPSGKATEVINCRCTMKAVLHIEKTKAELELEEQLKNKTYDDWKKEKKRR